MTEDLAQMVDQVKLLEKLRTIHKRQAAAAEKARQLKKEFKQLFELASEETKNAL